MLGCSKPSRASSPALVPNAHVVLPWSPTPSQSLHLVGWLPTREEQPETQQVLYADDTCLVTCVWTLPQTRSSLEPDLCRPARLGSRPTWWPPPGGRGLLLGSNGVKHELDPSELTFETLRKQWLARDEGRWSDAVAEDIDIDLLERNLELTPNDRFIQLQRMLQIYFSRPREL